MGFYSYLARTGRKEIEPETKEHGAGHQITPSADFSFGMGPTTCS
jgi:hypothetical protein